MLSKLSTPYRILIVFSIVWIFVSLAGIEPWRYRSGWAEYIIVGIIPMILLWGIIWIIKGKKGHPTTQTIKKYFQERASIKTQEGLSPEFTAKLLLVGRKAEASGKSVRDFLFDIGYSIKDAEELNTLHKQLKLSNEEPYHCPICNVTFKRENGKFASNGLVVCYDCYNKIELQLKETKRSKEKGHYTLY